MCIPEATKDYGRELVDVRGGREGANLLRLVKLLFRLLAARAFPVLRQILEGHTIMFGGVIDIAADGTDVLPTGMLI